MNLILKDALGASFMTILLTLVIERYIVLSVAQIIFQRKKIMFQPAVIVKVIK